MALLKSAQQTACPHCQAANPQGSPYCVRCGAPLGELHGPSALAPAAHHTDPSSRFASTVLQSETLHFQDSFLSEGQDPILAKSTFERAAGIMISGETIDYVATANRAVGHMPDCVVVTNKRIMLYKKRTFGKIELDDMFWRDLEGVQMKEGRNGVLLIFDSIQGWQIIAESLPKSQAWRLQEFAFKYSERLAGKAQESIQLSQPAQPVPVPVVPQVPAPTAPVSLAQVAAPRPTPTPQAAPTQQTSTAPAAPAAPRQYIYAAQAAAPTQQPSQMAAFHSSPPAQSEVVVFDTQTTNPVLRTPAEAAPASAKHASARPASGPLAAQQAPAPTRPATPASATPPAQSAPATPVKATGPLPFGQGQPQTQPRLGSGPLSSRLNSTPLSPAQHAFSSSPISAPLTEPPASHDDLVRKMKQLKDLLEAELITREDFEAKKAEILGRL